MKDIIRNYKQHKLMYWIALVIMTYFIIFSYIPMGGLIMAFQKYKMGDGILGSKFVGFENFIRFFEGPYFARLMINTLRISLLDLLFSFPAPIILACMLNELRGKVFKRTVQTITYMPYFLSMVVLCGLVKNFTSSDGIVTQIVNSLGGNYGSMLADTRAFVPIFIVSNIIQTVGFNSIIYLAALSSVDQELYEAAKVDGAGYFKQWIHITLPGISSTIVIMLILKMGQLMNVNFEKIILLYSQSTYDVADVISSYIYRVGLVGGDYSYSTAIGLFNSVIAFILVIISNAVSKKYAETSLF